jgi:hypothetical protein
MRYASHVRRCSLLLVGSRAAIRVVIDSRAYLPQIQQEQEQRESRADFTRIQRFAIPR